MSESDSAWLGIAIGSHRIRIAAHASDGRLIAEGRSDRPPRTPAAGAMIHDPEEDWWGGTLEALQDVWKRLAPERVRAIGLASLFPAMCLVDDGGRPLTEGFLFGDARGAAHVEAVSDTVGIRLTGDEVAPRLVWLDRRQPDLLARATAALSAAGYVVRRLTGETAIDPHSAVRWGGLARDGSHWDKATAVRLGIPPRLLPPIRRPQETVGWVSASASAATGLRPGTAVVGGATDSFCQLLGDGVSRTGDGLIYYGSSGTLTLATAHFADALADPSLISADSPYRLAVQAVDLAGFLETVRSQLLGGADKTDLDGAAGTVSPGAEGLMAYPWVTGCLGAAPRPAEAASLVGLALHHGRAHIWRAALESFGFLLMEARDTLTAAPLRVTAAGGGSVSQTWRRIVSDQTGWAQRLAVVGGRARGAAFLAALGSGTISSTATLDGAWPSAATSVSTSPDPLGSEQYKALLPVWRVIDGAVNGDGPADRIARGGEDD